MITAKKNGTGKIEWGFSWQWFINAMLALGVLLLAMWRFHESAMTEMRLLTLKNQEMILQNNDMIRDNNTLIKLNDARLCSLKEVIDKHDTKIHDLEIKIK